MIRILGVLMTCKTQEYFQIMGHHACASAEN
jgi:hypothetical protein